MLGYGSSYKIIWFSENITKSILFVKSFYYLALVITPAWIRFCILQYLVHRWLYAKMFEEPWSTTNEENFVNIRQSWHPKMILLFFPNFSNPLFSFKEIKIRTTFSKPGVETSSPAGHLVCLASEFSLPKLAYNIASKRSSMISRYIGSMSTEATLSHS